MWNRAAGARVVGHGSALRAISLRDGERPAGFDINPELSEKDGIFSAVRHVTGIPYAIAAFALGLWYLYATVRFARIVRNPEDPANRGAARNLLKVSVMYLPLLLLAMALNAQGRLHF